MGGEVAAVGFSNGTQEISSPSDVEVSNPLCSKIKGRHVALSFGVGAIAGLFAMIGELGYEIPLLPANLIDPVIGSLLLVSIVAPLVEEVAKPLGLMLLNREEQPNFAISQWALLGFFAGLGFALIEDALYMATVSQYGWTAMFELLAMRLLLPVHMVCTTLVGAGYGLWTKTRKPMHFIIFLALAMCIHGFFNFAVTVVG